MDEVTKKKAGRPTTKNIDTNTEDTAETIVDKTVEIIEKPKPTKKLSIPLDTDVSCRSAVRGTLSYLSKRTTGLEIVWDEFGDEQFVELQELVSMRNTDSRFFKDNWIVIEDSDDFTAKEIMDFIKVSQYYENVPSIDNFDSLFNEAPEKIIEKISKMSNGIKETIGMRAKQLYNNGVLDSIKRVHAIEEALGIEIENKG